jgi:hypothetical protein
MTVLLFFSGNLTRRKLPTSRRSHYVYRAHLASFPLWYLQNFPLYCEIGKNIYINTSTILYFGMRRGVLDIHNVTCGRSVVFSGSNSIRPPRYNRNIVESGVKHYNPLTPQSQQIIFPIYHELQIYLFCVLNKIEKLGQIKIE